ncbi:hypothetical protein DQK91_21920 [Oceanidesulfovibrio marinus]|uniref:Uncharacterized protein n=1 Tax=Oceanidesulfovibrio marinus TaxID=370038 RepID=A0A6P1ZAZ3_9BACT|nr:hypothetical protein DQK91_21920 [Oceanidesulfovibrio marinus]
MPAGLPEAGAFHLAFDDDGFFFRLMAGVAGLRNRLLATPYGDQAQFFTARLFRELGGYPDLPLMEEVAIMHPRGVIGRIAACSRPRATRCCVCCTGWLLRPRSGPGTTHGGCVR